MTRRSLWLLCVFVGAHAAGAQDSLVLAGVGRETAVRLAEIVDAARSSGLPTDPIISKISQGVLRHASPERIVVAAQSVATRLEEARAALAPAPTPADITAGENALGVSGVTRAALQAVRSTSPNRPVAVPLGLLAQLVASNVPAKRATEIVTDLIRRGASNAQLVALGNEVNSDVERGVRLIASLDVRLQGLTAVLAPPAGGSAAASAPVGLQSGSGPKKP